MFDSKRTPLYVESLADEFQRESLVVMDKSGAVVTKTLTLPSERENSVTEDEINTWYWTANNTEQYTSYR